MPSLDRLLTKPTTALGAVLVAVATLGLAGCATSTGETGPGNAAASAEWDNTFPASDAVSVEKVNFGNRLGITLAGDLYMPKNIDTSVRHPALIVGHPYGGVKEQTSGLYAQQMAERGFVTLAFDASYGGESGGTPRNIASPEAFTEDFSAAVDFLGTHQQVDRDRIGVIGICGSGGFSLAAAAADPRIRALATVSMYDMGRAMRQGLNDTVSEDQRKANLAAAAQQRWAEADGAGPQMVAGTLEELTPQAGAVDREFFDYYRTPRGHHPRATTEFTLTSQPAMNAFFPMTQIEAISPRPLLFVAGENAHSRYFSEDAFARAAEPKQLVIVPGAGHVDLYDRTEIIPFDRLTEFFDQNLA
ncbi:alpha/beta hydrolase [Skermania sp. ID1734]|uniref:alpha/beta hydrolase n=1 Tax=Skermania sp. ID1734 TaxID=2597516 RepID=UPI00118086E9|nr:alpha/beta hydrolase [Skermania sp. ID1734]TSD92852.1 alpha/beta hydrolase [Skermania sp. ID1734]